MKFTFDHKTGTMVPQQKKQIYFAGSMSGGLRIDDEINNVKFVIERDGRITNIFNTKSVKLYDRRNAVIIAERVKRKLGPNHPYADFQNFVK